MHLTLEWNSIDYTRVLEDENGFEWEKDRYNRYGDIGYSIGKGVARIEAFMDPVAEKLIIMGTGDIYAYFMYFHIPKIRMETREGKR